MPTPSGRLHLGHAWLLIIMDCLIKQARSAGHQADIVLVLDDLTSLAHGAATEGLAEKAKWIIEDAAWLGVEFAEVVSNYSYPYESPSQAKPMRGIPCQTLATPCLYPTHLNALYTGMSYYLKNCVIDAALEITHIIRGADQLARASTYKTLYEFLEMPSPRMVYLPFVHKADGAKIVADGTYSVEAVKKNISRDDILAVLVSQCLKRPDSDINASMVAEEAHRELLGEDWKWILGMADSDVQLRSFLNRVEAAPRISQDHLAAKALAEKAN